MNRGSAALDDNVEFQIMNENIKQHGCVGLLLLALKSTRAGSILSDLYSHRLECFVL